MRRVWLLAIGALGCGPAVGESVTNPIVIAADPATEAVASPVPDERSDSLTPVAFREGRIELARVAEQAWALIDGEPIQLRPGHSIARDPTLAVGLLPDKPSFGSTHELIAFAGTHVVYAEHAGEGPTYFSYAREGGRWVAEVRPRTRSDFWIETHHAAIVERGGSLLGLRRPEIHSELWDWGDDPDPRTAARLDAIGRELGRAPRGFERLAGELASVPELPRGWDVSDAVATSSGRIVALGFRHALALDDEPGSVQVLDWAPGEVTPTITQLPGLVEPAAAELGIWAAGEVVLIGGLRDVEIGEDAAWLATRAPDGSFTEVALELPIPAGERVASATATPDGELWIVTGGWNFASTRPCSCLWRKPIDGAWQLVELEPVALFRDAEARWAHVWTEQNFIEVPAGIVTPRWPAAREVIAADGAIWVTAELGPSYPTAEPVLADPRMVLYSSVPNGRATELIATDQLFDERVDRLAQATSPTPGSDACRTFTLVLADELARDGEPVPDALVERLTSLAEVASIEDDQRWASASLVYVGELDGRAQLVAEANAWDPASAVALADAFAQVLGSRPALDCRPRAMIRPVEWLR